jgi:hypothetical protein
MNMRKRLIGLAPLLLLAAYFAAPLARATTLARLSLVQLARAADSIVRVRCISSASRWDNGAIWTFNEFAVVERLKGLPQDRITVRVPGGRVGHLVTAIEAAPQFRPGEETVLFLEKTSAGDFAVTAWAEGTFRIETDPRTGVQTVTQDSTRFPVFDVATRRFSAEGIRGLSLEEFHARLAAAMEQPAPGGSR